MKRITKLKNFEKNALKKLRDKNNRDVFQQNRR